ncbi:MAG: histidinol dehydrogenase [Lachnospiraceae bacterium]|nr:histidinol dehydrogenase [Lachnospiraceae bacterium]
MKCIKEAAAKTYGRDTKTAKTVAEIINNVIANGDAEIYTLSKKFDGLDLEYIRVPKETVKAAYDQVDQATIEAMKAAADQIRFYAEKQLACMKELDTETPVPGVRLGHRLVPVDSVGCYVPGGRYPLPSTALMLAIPAKVAGVKRIAACSPASKVSGTIHPAVLAAMDIAGVDEIYCVGGAQAIAAFTYGTESIRKVDMICGPGNRFVTEAKRQVIGEVGIDSLAGPSEVLIVADESANPDFTAIDILAQSEHDPNARATLVTTSPDLAEKTLKRVTEIAAELPTGELALKSWEDNGMLYLADSMDEAIDLANEMAPEHLEVQVKPEIEQEVSDRLLHYGSLFVGHYTPVTFGDYCSGTNHTLPTMRTARYSNGVWVGTFIKTSFVQHITEEGCRNLASTAVHMAGTEGLMAHRKSITIRMEAMDQKKK